MVTLISLKLCFCFARNRKWSLLLFPGLGTPITGDPICDDWFRAVSRLGNYADLPSLTLIIYMRYSLEYATEDFLIQHSPPMLRNAQGSGTLHRGYFTLLFSNPHTPGVCMLTQRLFRDYLQEFDSNPYDLLQPHGAILEPCTILRKGGLERFFVFLEWNWRQCSHCSTSILLIFLVLFLAYFLFDHLYCLISFYVNIAIMNILLTCMLPAIRPSCV